MLPGPDEHYPTAPKFDTVILERRALAASAVMSRAVYEERNALGLSGLEDLVQARLESAVYGMMDDRGSKDVRFTFPATPWQHFKWKYMPVWFRKCFPVKFTGEVATVEWTRWTGYPHLVLAEPMPFVEVTVARKPIEEIR